MRLRTKITVATTICLFILFLIIMSFNTYTFYQEAKNFRTKEIESNINNYKSEIEKLIGSATKLGKEVSNLGENLYYFKTISTFNFKEILPLELNERVKEYPEILGAGIWFEPNLTGEKFFGPYSAWLEGKNNITWEYSNEKYNYFSKDWYRLAIPDTWNRKQKRENLVYRLSPYVDDLDGIKTVFLTFSTLMYSKQNEILGVSTVDIGLNNLKKLLSEFKVTENSFVILVDKYSGKLIFHPKEENLLSNYKDIPYLTDQKIDSEIRAEFDVGLNNQKYKLISIPTKYSFIIYAMVNQNEAYSVMYKLILRNLLIGVISLILIAFIIFSLVKESTKPLEEIIQLLRDISSGKKNINEKIKIKTEDEFGELAKTYNDMSFTIDKQNQEIKDHNEKLEEKVANRTAQLNKTLEEITSLKTKQDGDYYLTSLLLDPLGKKSVNSGNIDINYRVIQKKKFNFKKYNKEIGGDLCTASEIILQGKTFTVFLNADAMGKSIQGAGGALILGSVFNAIVQRTMFNEEIQKETPEKWLKKSFLELHKTFETFDGSMLVSVVISLLDNYTGLVYFVNAEHPTTVLYRDGKAEFLNPKNLYMKLGVSSHVKSTIYVETFQLLKGDILILGSDGRDDILNSETKMMNEDETKFLKIVEKSGTDLDKMISYLQESGEISDDLSLLRLEYKWNQFDEKILTEDELNKIEEAKLASSRNEFEKAIFILNQIPNSPTLLKEKIQVYLNTKSHLKIIELCEEYLNFKPDDEEIINELSISYKVLKKLSKAYSISEKLWIRNSNNINFLTNFSEINDLMGNKNKKDLIDYKINQLNS